MQALLLLTESSLSTNICPMPIHFVRLALHYITLYLRYTDVK